MNINSLDVTCGYNANEHLIEVVVTSTQRVVNMLTSKHRSVCNL